MEILKRQYDMLLKHISTKHIRNIYNEISWNSRLIGIKGARGVGKTTLMLQRIALSFPDKSKAFYASLDNIWFGAHNLLDLAEMASNKGITHLFLDEVHRLPGWQRQIKNVYDSYPEISVVFTGSSLLEMDHSIADLSRRCLMYAMHGLSFREFLEFEDFKFQPLTLSEILYNHLEISTNICEKTDITSEFHKYLKHGFYPFYKNETVQNYLTRVSNMMTSVIDYDIPAVENMDYASLLKTKQMLTIMASQSPSPLNITSLSQLMGMSRNQVIKILSLLDRAMILRLLYYKSERNPKSMCKPNKVLFSNPSLLNALGYPDKGKERESFMASMLSVSHEVGYPKEGDLIVDNRYLFEIGGAGKGFSQIRNLPDSFVAADLPIGIGNKIPLWLFGFLY